jgi:transposase
MSIVQELEAAGEILSPAVRAALVALETRVHELEIKIKDLEARLATNSTNSSKPPSSDPPGTSRRKRRASGRARGGQKGHPGSWRSLLPPERVDEVIAHRPDECRHCGHALEGAPEVGTPRRHQQIELPRIRAVVSEHRAHLLSCPRCGKRTRGEIPREVTLSHFGPQLVALGAMLISRFSLSRRDLEAFCSDLLDVPSPSLGTTQAFANEAAAALLPAYREVRRAVRRSECAGVDETGWKLRGSSRWIWTAATARATLFHLGRSRSRRDLERLVGPEYSGVVTSDRWRTYKVCRRRQLCWAHLQRNLEGLALRGGEAAHFARWGLSECAHIFEAWNAVKSKDLDRPGLRRRLAQVRARLGRLLSRGGRGSDRKVAAFCRDLKDHWDALWTFATVAGVEPTNNAAERALRRAVLWRKCCFGSQSGRGLRFVERMLTITETCRQNQTNGVFPSLHRPQYIVVPLI